MATATSHASCPECRLRFTPAAAAYLPSCPTCGGPLRLLDRLEGVVGFRLFRSADAPYSLPQAVAVSMPIPDPGLGRS
jgi:hypothetical protein